MRKTLRRSCDACAKSKLSCDLRTPRCSRCAKRESACVYANQPLSASSTDNKTTPSPQDSPINEGAPVVMFINPGIESFDPFDTYPQTRLPRSHVQRLIQHFLSHITFQYYPLDLDIMSNPFVVSWWPLALADPALFHVSLQTASLDVELRAQKGFTNSEVLMADCVSLVRQKLDDPSAALQDATMDTVVTLAAIECGKGNMNVSAMHIDGVKRLVHLRGGINSVKCVSPLTARMVAWVSMVIMQSPQFPTQDDYGCGHGIAPISQWYEATNNIHSAAPTTLEIPIMDPEITDVLCRLHNLFDSSQYLLTSTDLHDLTLFVVHRLLLWSPRPQIDGFPFDLAGSGSVRHALVLYLLMIQGPTYFSHAHLQYATAIKLQAQLEHTWYTILHSYSSLAVWLLSVGMASSDGAAEAQWFTTQACTAVEALHLQAWDDVVIRLREIVWLDSRTAEPLLQRKWDEIFALPHT
ncbi:uncharacterized protein EKO05_0007169 [Ascochyta rabiei]|uniref:uncharacterized protein n=1 Tax=Didymella rabiei TaxID=5454 RepID=UPI00220C204C|nr:uncharacterized protein EKO05_0007169 [Ascochyta rabiei]UPX16783.1 hypothetical protein EKO05_0007169 [Ascochyta rabiei]